MMMSQIKMIRNEKVGLPLIPSAAIWQQWDRQVQPIIKKMYLETRRELIAVFNETNFIGAMDASPVSQSRIVINKILNKYEKIFNDLSESIINKMISSVISNSSATLKISLKDYINPLEIDRTATNLRLSEIIKASTEESVNLIKRIPQKYLGQVQGEVMRSITTGKGLKDLVPYLTEKYQGDARWAKHVAMDQTRKATENISRTRLMQLGVEKFKWVHTQGSRHPRKYHQELSGKIFRFDDPPIINKETGKKGYPSDEIFCRCVLVPVFFSSNDDD